MLGIDEHRFCSVRFFKDPDVNAWQCTEPRISAIVDLDTGQALGWWVAGTIRGAGAWLFKRPLDWRLCVKVVAIHPSATLRKALRMSLHRTVVSVNPFPWSVSKKHAHRSPTVADPGDHPSRNGNHDELRTVGESDGNGRQRKTFASTGRSYTRQ